MKNSHPLPRSGRQEKGVSWWRGLRVPWVPDGTRVEKPGGSEGVSAALTLTASALGSNSVGVDPWGRAGAVMAGTTDPLSALGPNKPLPSQLPPTSGCTMLLRLRAAKGLLGNMLVRGPDALPGSSLLCHLLRTAGTLI